MKSILDLQQVTLASVFAFLSMVHAFAVLAFPKPPPRDVLIKRQGGGFGDHKPQIWSGPYPCYDKDGAMKFPPPRDPPWFTDDKCHMSVCLGALVVTRSLCVMKGVSCPAGQYLSVPPNPSSLVDCCQCKPYEPLR